MMVNLRYVTICVFKLHVFKGVPLLKIKNNTYLSELHSHKVLVK